MDIEQFGPDDAARLARVRRGPQRGAVRRLAVGAPADRCARPRASFRHGWDGEPALPFLGAVDGTSRSPSGSVHQRVRQPATSPGSGSRSTRTTGAAGYGTADAGGALAEQRATAGRTSFGTDGWERTSTRRSRPATGSSRKSKAINRRQFLADARLRRPGPARTTRRCGRRRDYELVRRRRRHPRRRARGRRGDDRRHQRRAHRRPRHRGRGVPAGADPRLRARPGVTRARLLPGPRPAPGDRRARRPHRRRRRRGAARPRRAARHVGRGHPPRPPARPAAQGGHEPLAARGRSRSWSRSTPGTPSPTTT